MVKRIISALRARKERMDGISFYTQRDDYGTPQDNGSTFWNLNKASALIRTTSKACALGMQLNLIRSCFSGACARCVYCDVVGLRARAVLEL